MINDLPMFHQLVFAALMIVCLLTGLDLIPRRIRPPERFGKALMTTGLVLMALMMLFGCSSDDFDRKPGDPWNYDPQLGPPPHG